VKARAAFLLLAGGLIATRLCHIEILWPEETLPSAAAVQILQGHALYRDVWFDKPPLVALAYLAWGAATAWPLRLAGALYAALCCALAYLFARDLWGEREGLVSAALLAFFLTFGLPAAVIPLAADLLLLAPHIAAVWLASRGSAFSSGVIAGVALMCNTKAIFVLVICALWKPRVAARVLAGFACTAGIAHFALWAAGALPEYLDQVWRWGFLYSRDTFLDRPVWNGIMRTANWTGFHLCLLAGAAWFWLRDRSSDRTRFGIWAALSLIAVCAGWRFFPRYFFQLLPVFTLAGARGLILLGPLRIAALALLLVPLVRFGPRYAVLAADLASGRRHDWSDIVMDQDSRETAALLSRAAVPGSSLLVWGYRPEIFTYTRLPAGTRFLESQPLTGVLADRHLFQSEPTAPDWAQRNRSEVARSSPTFIVDGLTRFNPSLAIGRYPELRDWFSAYREIGRTRFTVIWERARE
jgi:hypothetical protein